MVRLQVPPSPHARGIGIGSPHVAAAGRNNSESVDTATLAALTVSGNSLALPPSASETSRGRQQTASGPSLCLSPLSISLFLFPHILLLHANRPVPTKATHEKGRSLPARASPLHNLEAPSTSLPPPLSDHLCLCLSQNKRLVSDHIATSRPQTPVDRKNAGPNFSLTDLADAHTEQQSQSSSKAFLSLSEAALLRRGNGRGGGRMAPSSSASVPLASSALSVATPLAGSLTLSEAARLMRDDRSTAPHPHAAYSPMIPRGAQSLPSRLSLAKTPGGGEKGGVREGMGLVEEKGIVDGEALVQELRFKASEKVLV